MKLIFYIVTILLFLIAAGSAFGQDSDSSIQIKSSVQTDTITEKSNLTEYDESGDFSPGLFFFAMIGLGFILISTVTGIALTVLGLVIIFGLVSFGILSTSIIVGLNKKSFATGFKTLVVLTSTFGGLIIFSGGFWILNKIAHWWSTQTALITGATCGILTGLTFGLTAYYILRRLTSYFTRQLKLTNTKPVSDSNMNTGSSN
jgi:hypothetical protein